MASDRQIIRNKHAFCCGAWDEAGKIVDFRMDWGKPANQVILWITFFSFSHSSLPFSHHLPYNCSVSWDILLCISLYKVHLLRLRYVGKNFPTAWKMYFLCSVLLLLSLATTKDAAASPCPLFGSADNGSSLPCCYGCWYGWFDTDRSFDCWTPHFRSSISLSLLRSVPRSLRGDGLIL